jgi:type II secretory pathway component PulF
METVTLDDFMAWNDELHALAQAGVPIDVGLARGGDTLDTLEKINATVARRVSQGASLREAIQSSERVVSPTYGGLMLLGLSSGNLGAALGGATRLAESIDDAWRAVRFSFVYPLIVCGLAYAGIVGFCLYFVPALENLHTNLRIPTGAGLRVLQGLRDTLAYWVALPPLALLLVIGWQRAFGPKGHQSSGRAARALPWLPGVSRAIEQQRLAVFADSLATLLEGGAPLPEALRLAAGACASEAMAGSFQALAESLDRGPTLGDESRLAQRIPPFLRYALWHAEPTIGRARALRMAAGLYRDSARRHIERLRVVAPLIACILVGGSVTLLYGLALFVPVVEMLRSLAS